MKKEEVFTFDRDDILLLILKDLGLLNEQMIEKPENMNVLFLNDEQGKFIGLKLTVSNTISNKEEK